MIKERIFQWLKIAHIRFPLPFKWLARGAISGTVAGFILSLGYSMLFGLPVSFVVFLMSLGDFQSNGVEAIGNGIGAALFVIGSLIVQCVLPSAAIGLVCGAITGIGIYFSKKFVIGSSFRAISLSFLFWIPLTYFVSTHVLPKIVLYRWQWSDSFDLWLFIFAPSIIFVFAMAYVAKKSLKPFIQSTVNV